MVYNDGVTPKQKAFVFEYLIDRNATQAAIRAGYSPKTSYSIGQRLLKNVEISSEFDRVLEEKAMKANEVLSRMADIARGSAADYLTIDKYGYTGINLEQMKADGKLHLIKKYKPTKYGSELELYDAQSALVQLGKHHGLWVDKDTADWRKEIIELLKAERITPEQVRAEVGEELATELFESAGISAITS